MKPISNIVSKFKENIFSKMSNLAKKHNAINLSQGYPDFDGPEWVKELACKNIKAGLNQSAPATGTDKFKKAISHNYKLFYDLDYHHQDEITVTVGATEAIFSTILALVNPGDEVVVFEPFFDTYIPAIKLAGGIIKTVTLHAPDFTIDEDELISVFSKKTKLVILNTPHNPSGKVFSKTELEQISKQVIKYDAYLISDEVYEFLTYNNSTHIPPATLSGMKDRTITISSTGKTFGLTGWRIGWAAASREISLAIRLVHQNNTFSAAHPLQEAMAEAIYELKNYVPDFKNHYQKKRDLLFSGLDKAGYRPIRPSSTYFILCPIEHITKLNSENFSIHLTKTKNIATIPASAFYLNSKEGESLIRFCFAKRDETLFEALNHLNHY